MNTYLRSLEKFGMNLGLERIKALLTKLGHPQLDFQSIHIAGTNGKGSTAVMIASILKEAGYRVGLYTSPHLLDYPERIKVNGKNISRADFALGIKKVRRAVGRRLEGVEGQPTVFEVLTALACWYFAKRKVNVAVLEVGLGGRLDATNVVYPLVSVVTNIELEHTEVLGRTLGKIAAEKGAIIKPGRPVVTAERKTEPLRVLKKLAKKNDALLVQVKGYDSVRIPHLIGEHQKLNAACAVAAVRLAGLIVTRAQIRRGLRRAEWPGRFQILSKRPLIVVDGAHNPAGSRVLRRALARVFPGKFTVIFGAQENKAHRVMLRELAPVIGELIVTRSSHPQAADPVAAAAGYKGKTRIAYSLAEAIERWEGRTPLLVTGSLFLAGDFLRLSAS